MDLNAREKALLHQCLEHSLSHIDSKWEWSGIEDITDEHIKGELEALKARFDKPICPDCGKELNAVLRQVDMEVVCDLDHNAKTIIPQTFHVAGDIAYRCPHCDSLNVEELLVDYEFNERR
jgi:ssDNA-binding Zn-finger/Zn-ribbon topoisomerase 1